MLDLKKSESAIVILLDASLDDPVHKHQHLYVLYKYYITILNTHHEVFSRMFLQFSPAAHTHFICCR